MLRNLSINIPAVSGGDELKLKVRLKAPRRKSR